MSTLIGAVSIVSINSGGSPVVVHVDFGAATSVSVVDVQDAVLSGDPLANALKVQWSTNNVDWFDFGAAATLGGGLRTRRFAAPPSAMATARYWRIIIGNLAGANGRSLAIATIGFLSETAVLSGARVAPHFAGEGAQHVHVLSDISSDIYARGELVGHAVTPFTSGILGRIDWARDLATLLMFHEQVQPWKLFRQGADDQWDARAQAFTNIPLFEFPDATYVNGVNEVQQIAFASFVNGDTFNVTFDGETTSTIVYSNVAATTAANIKAALEALDAMGGGTVTVTNTSGTIFSITFQGAAGQWDWAEIAADPVASANGIATTATLTEGKAGGEAIVSTARGWWCSGIFDDKRLILIGPRSAPKVYNASVSTDYFNLYAAGRRATDGIMDEISSNDATGLRQICAASFLTTFTETGVASLRTDTLLGDDANPFKSDSAPGIQDRLRPEEIDGAIMYVQNGGRAIYELIWSDDKKGHIAENVSVHAAELVKQPTDMFARRAGFGFECDALMLSLAEGGMAVFQSLRAKNFRPLHRVSTPGGKFICGGQEEKGATYVVVEREIDGVVRRCVEGFDISRLLDSSVMRVLADPAEAIGGLAHLEGGTDVWAIGSDGWFYGPFTVEAGEISLDGEAFSAGSYEVGRFFDAWADPMPIRFDAQGGSIAGKRKRIATCAVSVLNSMPPGVVYMGQRRDFADRHFGGGVLDAPPMDNLITGRLGMDRMRGWSTDPAIRFRRVWPGPLHIRAIELGVVWTS